MYNRILGIALMILNRRGYLRTQLQDILEESEISLEEFNEHFSDLNDVIIVIFDQFCREAEHFSASLEETGPTVGNFYNNCLSTFEGHKKYSFIFHDFYYINTEIEQVKDRYFELLRLRKAQLSHLFQKFVEDGIFKKEIIPGQFENLINQILVMGGFWPTHSKIIFEGYHAQYYSKLTFSMLIPYFTEKGLEECKKTDYLKE